LRDVNEALTPGSKFIKDIRRRNENWNKEPIFLLQKGIVISVNLNTDQKDTSFYNPPYSLNLRLINEDYTNKNAQEILDDNPKWYQPLFPNQFIILPEIGEEVLVLREYTSKESVGYWICRVNDSAIIKRKLAREHFQADNPLLKYNFPFDVNEVSEKSKQDKTPDKIFETEKLNPGDIAILGRCGSYCIHTYKDGNTRYLQGISSLVNIECYELIKFSDIDKDYSFYNEDIIDEESNILNLKADKFVQYSHLSENKLYSQVYGDKLIELLKKMSDNIEVLNNKLLEIQNIINKHVHSVPATSLRTIIDGREVYIEQPESTTLVTENNNIKVEESSKILDEIKQVVENNEILSKYHFLN